MRWFDSSTTASKKRASPSRSVRTLVFVLLGCAAIPQALSAADLALVVFPEDGFLAVDASIVGYAGPSVVETVHEGLRSEVRFTIQIYRDETGVSGLLGDTLLGEFSPTHLAHWDPFQRMYTIRRHDGSETAVADRTEYVEELFTLKGYRIPADVFEAGRDYYLLGQAAVVPVRLVPALSILSVFTDRQIAATDWVRSAIPTDIVDTLAGVPR
jgi:hypothetical protein